ncbi:MAG: hypothetical protein GW855_04440 [Erythrobacter sp.]|nr:hypothetical protein [Erythrobacter sp.]NCQ62555.1 hypothetical protein [Alphaproteobacteria bacterium]
MGRFLLLLVLLAALGVGAWLYFGDGMRIVTERSVEIALVEAGVPEDQAACMAPRMTERLTPEQLRKLENVAPQDGEAAMPRDAGEALARIRRVNDPEVVEVTVRAAAACAFGGIFEKL